MAVFTATLEQTAFLLCFIVLGYILTRWKFVQENAQAVLSRLENCVFIPALVLGTFIGNFTTEKLSSAWRLFLGSFVLGLAAIALALLCARLCGRSKYERDIYTYGLSFSNFGFMGNAVVSALFPDIFMEYLIFTLPLWTLIYLWGVPVLLLGDGAEKPTLRQRLKAFQNPMLACTLLGMAIGLLGIPVPGFLSFAVSAAGSCMSPIAMLLTGMTIARSELGQILRIRGVYVATFLRLLVFPLLFMGIMVLIPFREVFATCAVCSLAMPLGLNTIIVPSGLGKDTKVASGMALVSHILSCVTIPLIFMLYGYMSR
ncbi:MAG: AEC family transporter [Clostridia bacterium]|nr:AEC family transporter [Clostridia bacterium]